MNVISACKHEASRDIVMGDKSTRSVERYSISGDDLYTTMLKKLAGTDGPNIVDPVDLAEYTRLLKHFRSEAFSEARSHASCHYTSFTDPASTAQRAKRAEVLEFLRKWFTAELRDAVIEDLLRTLRDDTAASHSLGEADSADPTDEQIAAVRQSFVLNFCILVPTVKCLNCDGAGVHTVGASSPKEIPCETCEGKGTTRIDPFWKL